MFAVLNDAIRYYQTNVGVGRPQARGLLAETKEWLFTLPGDAPFSFESICEVLQIDARDYGAHFYDVVTRKSQVVSLGAFCYAVL